MSSQVPLFKSLSKGGRRYLCISKNARGFPSFFRILFRLQKFALFFAIKRTAFCIGFWQMAIVTLYLPMLMRWQSANSNCDAVPQISRINCCKRYICWPQSFPKAIMIPFCVLFYEVCFKNGTPSRCMQTNFTSLMTNVPNTDAGNSIYFAIFYEQFVETNQSSLFASLLR